MKKFLLWTLSTGILSLSILSCRKDETIITAKPASGNNAGSTNKSRGIGHDGVTVSADGFLVFASEDVYEAKLQELSTLDDQELNNWENDLGYVSLRQALNIETPDNPVATQNRMADDDLFRTIINKDGIIQIGSYLFKAETDKGYVSELNEADIQYYERFKTGDFIDGITNRFGLDEDDAFGKLADGLKGSNTAGRGANIFGKGDKYNDDVTNDADHTIWRADCKARYEKAVFYFSLMTEMKYMWKASNNVFWHQYTTNIHLDVCDYKWENKRGQTGYNPAYYQAANDNKLTFRAYSGARGLKKNSSYIKATFKYENVPSLRQWRMVPFFLQAFE